MTIRLLFEPLRNRYLDKFVADVVQVARRLRPLPDRPAEEVRETFATKLELSMKLAISKYKPIQVRSHRTIDLSGRLYRLAAHRLVIILLVLVSRLWAEPGYTGWPLRLAVQVDRAGWPAIQKLCVQK